VTTEAVEEPRGSTPTEPPELVGASPKQVVANGGDSGEETCVALYAYTSEEPGDLTFEAGESIQVIKKEAEWWTGKIGDRTGVFPFNYVEVVAAASSATAAAPNEEGATPKEKEEMEESKVESTTTVPEVETAEPESAVNGGSDQAAASAEAVTEAAAEATPEVVTADAPAVTSESESESKSKKPEIATVVAAYTATSKEQLTLARGQMVLVRKKTSTGWWQGELQGGKGKKRQLGWFPATYVKLAGGGTEAPVAEAPAGAEDQPTGEAAATAAVATTSGEGGPKFRALYTYAGQHEDELSFEAGDIITLLSKDEEAWWKGELNGKSGVFPSNYVEEIPTSG